MVKTDVKPLIILNASAGSGKTFNLVKEYIKLLISEETQGSSFSNIIAMTFTNKAALEMKERIITALDEISSPVYFDNKADSLVSMLSDEIKLSHDLIQLRCKKVLESILHQYEEFHVMTIDKFNLRLIKSFGRDLDIPGEFDVILDESPVIEQVVDELLNQLGSDGNANLNTLLFKYAKTNVDDGASWNFRNNLIKFGAVLKSEKNVSIISELLKLDFSIDSYHEIFRRRKLMDSNYCELCRCVMSELNENDPTILPGGKNTINDILKLSQGTQFPIQRELINPRLSANLSYDGANGKVIPWKLKDALHSLNNFWSETITAYATIDLYLKNFFNMALLQYMAEALTKIKKEEQIIRISEFNTLISELIQHERAPFIYERLGTKLKHFLLDEFQDTSHLQWLNLVPLVHESLSQNHKNLIVGDPKQSIYRFKNGVAEQFVALPKIYNPEQKIKIKTESDYFESMGGTSELLQNWRSSSSIVQFNNAFFEKLRESIPNASKEFYASIKQEPKSDINGLVKIVSKEEKLNNLDLIPFLIETIEECKKDGFKLGEICILGGKNRDCNSWALELNNAGYKVVSTESLLINSDLKVQLSIAYLKWRLKPTGENEKKRFAELYFRANDMSYNEFQNFILEKKSSPNKTWRYFDEDKFLETYFGNPSDFFFKYESIYDLIQGFYRIAKFEELNNHYLHHLADIIYDFGIKKGPNLKVFLDDYEKNKNKYGVQIPESDEAINLMTIHKSKGLEFPIVIIPSLNFDLEIKTTFLLKINDTIIYKKPNSNEILQPLIDLYNEERNQIITDFMNLCYVGMTRPVERLYIKNSFEKKKFGEFFHNALTELGKNTDNDGELIVDINDGTRTNRGKTKRKKEASFVPINVHNRLWFPDISLQDMDELLSTDYLTKEMQFGIQFHYLASKIEHEEAIGTAIKDALHIGEISKNNVVELSGKLHNLFKLTEYRTLFISAIEILNEQEIIVAGEKTLRPDKIIVKESETIVVDFKTGIPSVKDQKQVNAYKSTLETMGYPNVKCYLFYSSTNNLQQIN